MQHYTKDFKLTEHLAKVSPDVIKEGRAFFNKPRHVWAAAIHLSTAAVTPIAKLFIDAFSSNQERALPRRSAVQAHEEERAFKKGTQGAVSYPQWAPTSRTKGAECGHG